MDFYSLEQDQTPLVHLHIFFVRPFLIFSYNLTLSAFEPQFLNSMELLNSCKHFMRLVSLPSDQNVLVKSPYFFKKINKEFARAWFKFSFEIGKNVDCMKNLKFLSGLRFHLGLVKLV